MNESPNYTKEAIAATLHCLTGCAIGEILGLILATWWNLSNLASIILAIILAFFFGYSLTIMPVKKSGLSWADSIKTALASDSLSITSMEISDNVIVLIIPGALTAGLGDGLFWLSLVISLAVAFIVTVPVNRWLISRGLGHAHHNH